MSRFDRAEQGRVDAEKGRVVAEDDRVTAEGDGIHPSEESRRQAETGRVDAESGRVDADVRRDEDASAVYRRVTTLYAMRFGFIFVIPILVFIVLLWNEDRQSDQTAVTLEHTIKELKQEVYDRCVDSRDNRAAIRSTIVQSFTALGYSYDDETGKLTETKAGPIDYYRTRPIEREQALARTINSLTETFPVVVCTPPA